MGASCIQTFPRSTEGEEHHCRRSLRGIWEANFGAARRPLLDVGNVPAAEGLGDANEGMCSQAEDTGG